jgi:acyl-CoA dehydrogenase
MLPADRLSLPWFGPLHHEVAAAAAAFAGARLRAADHPHAREDVDACCREHVRAMGDAGLLRYCVASADDPRDGAIHGGTANFDALALCLIRETMAWHDGLADFAFAMQGLGSGPISLAGDAALQRAYLPAVAAGRKIAAFALSEADAGSDVAAMATQARRDGDHYVLDGSKTWISNGGIADFYCVFARTAPAVRRADGSVEARGISAFVVEAADPGFGIEQRIDVIAPHPLATLRFAACRIPASRRIGAEGEGFKIAMRTLDVFRASVAAAALGFAQRALDEALAHVRGRRMFGTTLGEFQLTKAAIAEMATDLEAARLLTYQAAWLRDRGRPVTAAAAMAKMTATESAQRIIDRALQMFGGRGVVSGEVVERLYREIRALRIYEGATEVQKMIIAREVMR